MLLTVSTRYCATPTSQETHNVAYRIYFQENEHSSSFSDYLLPFENFTSVVQKLVCSCHGSNACYFSKIHIWNFWQLHKLEPACHFSICTGHRLTRRPRAYNVTLLLVLLVFMLPRLSYNSLIPCKSQTALLGDLISSATVKGTSVFM